MKNDDNHLADCRSVWGGGAVVGVGGGSGCEFVAMKWSGWEEFPIRVLDAGLVSGSESSEWRKGIHVGQVIHKLKVAMGENVGEIEGDQPLVRLQEGFLWEVALEYVQAGVGVDEALEIAFKRYVRELRKGVVKQLNLEVEGMRGTPDGLNTVEGELESWKCTRRSLGKAKTQAEFETNFWQWVMQEKAYCYMAGVDTVRWIVLWQAGDYGKGKGTGPRALQSVGVFEPSELVENWRVLMTHAGLRGAGPESKEKA